MSRDLTARELQVVRVYVDAGSCKVAAHQLGLHRRTVEQTLNRARRHADVETTPQLVRELMRRGSL